MHDVRPVDADAVMGMGHTPPVRAIVDAVPSLAWPQGAEVLPCAIRCHPQERAGASWSWWWLNLQLELVALEDPILEHIGSGNLVLWWGCKRALAVGPWWWPIIRRGGVCLIHPFDVLAPLELPGTAGLILYGCDNGVCMGRR